MVRLTADVKWIKIVTDIFDDDKILLIESMPKADAIIVIWFKLLCLAGKQNNGGVFLLNGRIAFTDEMFATIFRRPLNTVRLALSTFEQFGMIEIINDTITIPNWEKHQKLDALETSREATKNRVAKYREKQKLLADACNVTGSVTGNVTVTPGNADRIDKIREEENREYISSTDDDFSKFWDAYPRKDGKQDAIKAWKSLKPNADLQRVILEDIRRRLESGGAWHKTEKRFIKMAGPYLRGKRWEDEGGETEVATDRRPDEDVVIDAEQERLIDEIYKKQGRDAWM